MAARKAKHTKAAKKAGLGTSTALDAIVPATRRHGDTATQRPPAKVSLYLDADDLEALERERARRRLGGDRRASFSDIVRHALRQAIPDAYRE